MDQKNDQKDEDKVVDIEQRFSDEGSVKLPESERMRFGRQVLTWIGLFVVGICGIYIWQPNNEAAQAIFEMIKIGALPLVTLIVTFYFPTRSD